MLPALAQDLLEQRVSVRFKDVSLVDALYQLIDQEDIKLSFSKDILPNKTVDLRLKKNQLKTILGILLRDTDIDFKVLGNQVVLFKTQRPITKKKYTISGFLRDEETQELLIAASVYDHSTGKGTETNEYGFYSLTLSEGPVDIQYSYLGYVNSHKRFKLAENKEFNVNLKASLTLNPVVVIATDSTVEKRPTGMSYNAIQIKDVESLPKLAGESDLIRTIHMLPGIQTGADGIGGIHVRGGNVGQNLILIDDVPVYNVSHAAGVFSVFNTEAIKSVKLVKGGFPARYGGRVSSVLDIRTKEGNMNEYKANFNVGLLTAGATLEGPLQKGSSSFFISGRTSFLNLYLKPTTRFIKESRGQIGSTGYSFYDFNAKLNFSFTEKVKIYISVYSGSDDYSNDSRSSINLEQYNPLTNTSTFFRLDQSIEESLNWGNDVAAFRLNYLFNNKLFLNATATYSSLKLGLEYLRADSLVNTTEDLTERREIEYGAYVSSIEDVGFKFDFNLIPSTVHYIRFGVGGTNHIFNPGALSFSQTLRSTDPIFNEPIKSTEFYGYVEDEIKWEKWMINAGLRGTVHTVGLKNYKYLEPRLSIYYEMDEGIGLKASYSKMTQYLHLLSKSSIGLPTDLWVPSTANIDPQVSWQTVGGIDFNIGQFTSFSLEGYYKKMKNMWTYSEGANTLTNWEDNVRKGQGISYGIEFMWNQKIGKNTKAWLSYTWSKTNRIFSEINLGRTYPYRYDRTHDLKLVLMHRFKSWLEFSGNWQINTGLAYSLPLQTYVIDDIPGGPPGTIDAEFIEEKNSSRLPLYHRLDLSLNFLIKGKKWQHTINLGAYNVYNRNNPLYYRLARDNFLQPSGFVQVSLIPFLPSLRYTVKF